MFSILFMMLLGSSTSAVRISNESDLIKEMDANSLVRDFCVNSNNHDCRKIAALIHCAKKGKSAAHEMYCNNHELTNDYYKRCHIVNIAENLKLSPQQTTQELEWFLGTLEKLAQGE